MVHRLIINGTINLISGQYPLHLGGKIKAFIFLAVKKGLLPYAISSQKKRLAPSIPNGKGKHARKFFHTAASHLFIEMDDDLCVCRGAKNVPLGLQFTFQ